MTLLDAAGARNFLWLNLPQLATTPRGEGDPLNAALAQASTQFRTDVASETALLTQTLGVRIADVDVYALYQSILANPAAFGYTNVTTPAQGLAVNPDQYLFWDLPSHPTTTGHRLIGLDAEAAVLNTFAPEPATWVVGAGLILLVGWRRFRAVSVGRPGIDRSVELHASGTPQSAPRKCGSLQRLLHGDTYCSMTMGPRQKANFWACGSSTLTWQV